MCMNNTTLPTWDMTQFYADFRDPQMMKDLEAVKIGFDEFARVYRGRVGALTAAEMADALRLEEKLVVELQKPGYYLHLLYEMGGTELEEIKKISTQIDERATLIGNEMAFWGVELSARKDLNELALEPELANYRYHLERTALLARYVLSEDVEKVLSLKSMTSFDSWATLYTDMKSKIEVEHDFGDGLKKHRVPDLSDKMKSSDRGVRETAWKLLTSEYQKTEETVLNAYNNIMLDKKINDGLRGFTTAQEARTINNQVTQEVVDSLIDSISKNVGVYRRYVGIKQKLLGVDKMQYFDMMADVSFDGLEEKEYSWLDAQEIILKAFGEFDEEFATIAKQFFDNNWIDALDRPRKNGGAFMSDFAPQYHPVILVNFKGKFEDIMTIAHELGHGIHSMLIHKKQTLINNDYPMIVAEIASLCCETVVFDKLLETITDPRLKLKLLCDKVEQETGNIFIGGLGRYLFERKMHEIFRAEGPISAEQVRALWLQEYYGSMFGDTLEPGVGGEYTWQGTAHFTYLFYNYVYASGLLISSSIYEVLRGSPVKVAVYKSMLESGGSISPVDMLKMLDLEIEKPEFWDIGFGLLEAKVEMIERLALEVK
jgi:oligoendopeptidase F